MGNYCNDLLQTLGLFGIGSVGAFFAGYLGIAYTLAYPVYFWASYKFSCAFIEWVDKLGGTPDGNLNLVGIPIMGFLVVILNGAYFYYAGKFFG